MYQNVLPILAEKKSENYGKIQSWISVSEIVLRLWRCKHRSSAYDLNQNDHKTRTVAEVLICYMGSPWHRD